MSQKPKASRRTFLKSTPPVALGLTIVPRHVLGGPGHRPPSERVNIAGIGAGGMGGHNIRAVSQHGANIVALCDVDDERGRRNFETFPNARRYRDFRVMLEKESKNIDAVTVGTPDHVHAVASMAAIRDGKHVYCEKPLTHSIFEARTMATAAKKHGLATQMGNGGHAKEGARLTNEWIQAGVIGEVREVHVWTDRAGNYWPQGVGRPAETPTPPPGLDWDLWLGPAPNRPYHPMYHPQNWRGWWDFGTVAIGDMGCHIIDHPVWALQLGHPKSVEARATLAGLNAESFPVAAIIYYEFPARGKLPAVTMTWYEGGLLPPTPPVMSAGESLPGNGALYIGSRGVMYHGSGGDMPRLAPVELAEEARQVPKTMPRSVGHHREWLEACKGGKPAMSNFGYSGPLTEIVLLGNLALRTPGRRIEWDGEKMKALNAPGLDRHIRREYRAGWTL